MASSLPALSLLVLVVLLVSVSVSHGKEQPAPAKEGIEALDWLAGAWQSDQFETTYTSPRGGEIVSASKFLSKGRAVFFDYERFRTVEKDVVLTPYPGGNKSVDFLLTDFDPAKRVARFVNEKHDFPQSLTYERTGETTLRITLVGKEQGEANKMVLELSRP